jgi:glutaminyl-peptide cyclotransferase
VRTTTENQTHGGAGRRVLLLVAPMLLAIAGLGLVVGIPVTRRLAPAQRAPGSSHPAASQPPTGARARPAAPRLPAFDRRAAWRHLEAQLAFGPRPVGTPAHERLSEYLQRELRKQSKDVRLQKWADPSLRLPLTNVIARFPGKGAGSLLLAAHWDTRPTADEDPVIANRPRPIPGANDGASGVAVLLELAKVLKANPPPVTVLLVFFDGEDYGPGPDRMFLGSQYFAEHQPPGTPRKGVLLDMIGDADLQVPREDHSQQRARAVVDEVWAAARRAGHGAYFPDRSGGPIGDDHIPLLNAGIDCIDVIDFSYDHWHTLADTADKCSPRSLGIIGETMVAWIYGQNQ